MSALGRFLVSLLFLFGTSLPNASLGQTPPLSVSGYDTEKIAGFTLFLHPEIKKHEKEFKTSPMDVLNLELKMLGQILNKKALAKVQTLPFWVEWDEAPEGANTGGGTVIAYYLSTDLRMTRIKGEHPLRAKTITLCSLKTLTKLHQPGIDTGKCVLLHEVAHAVHDQLIGFENPEIKLAFTQAMNRKLYQPGLYMTSSSKEFFAELTCAYLDRLDHFPRNRGDLKKHDPATFKLLERIWSTSASVESAKSTTGTHKDPQTEELALIHLVGMEPGTLVQRNPPSFLNRKGNLLALAFWLDNQPSTLQDLDRLKKLQSRLPEMGVEMLLVSPADADPLRSAKVLKDKGITLAACSGLSGEVSVGPIRPPILLVFDSKGKAIHKGPDFAAEPLLRRLSMASRLDDGLTDFPEERSEWTNLRTMIRRGDSPGAILTQVAQYTKSQDADLAKQASKILSLLEKPIQLYLDQLAKEAEDAPAEVFGELNRLALLYRNLEVGTKAKELTEKLKTKPEVQAEIRATVHLDAIRKAQTLLDRMQSPGGLLPPQATTQLLILQNNMKALETKYPKSQAVAEAKSIVLKYIPQGMNPTAPNSRPGRP